jgi:hypothetical protein
VGRGARNGGTPGRVGSFALTAMLGRVSRLGRLLPLGCFLALAACSSTEPGPVAVGCGVCGSGLSCIVNADFPDGVCSKECDNQNCASGSQCVRLSVGQFCLQSCSGGGCPFGTVCGSAGAAGSVCMAPAAAVATAASCPSAPVLVSGGTAGPSAAPSGCQIPTVASTYAGSLTHVGVRQVGQSVTFQMPAGASGFTILSQGAANNTGLVAFNQGMLPNSPTPSPLLTPDGRTFFEIPPETVDPSSRNIVWSGPLSPLTAALTFPNSTAGLKMVDAGLPAGSWALTVDDLLHQCPQFQGCKDGGSNAGLYDITVLTRTGPIPDRGVLDVAIYLVSMDSTLTAANALTDAQMARAVSRIAADLARGGICLGTVTFYDVPQWARSRYSSLAVDDASRRNPCADYRQLFTLAQPGNVASLFFLDELTDPSGVPGNSTIGVDGSIPGVGTISGTIAGGAAVSAADLHHTSNCSSTFSVACGPDQTGETAAHELGHTLGLFHLTEADGATSTSGDSFDGLVDTPECLCSLCVGSSQRPNCADQPGAGSNPTLVEAASCTQSTQACGGGDYLMFWVLSSLSKGNLSPQEGQVMRMNPLVRPQ